MKISFSRYDLSKNKKFPKIPFFLVNHQNEEVCRVLSCSKRDYASKTRLNTTFKQVYCRLTSLEDFGEFLFFIIFHLQLGRNLLSRFFHMYRMAQQNVTENFQTITTFFLEKIFQNGFFYSMANAPESLKRGFICCRRIFIHWLRAFERETKLFFFMFFKNSQKFPKHDGKKEVTWNKPSF